MFNNELTSKYKISNYYVHAWNTIKPPPQKKNKVKNMGSANVFTLKIEIRGQVEELNDVSSV
jgi:hypothetical protein